MSNNVLGDYSLPNIVCLLAETTINDSSVAFFARSRIASAPYCCYTGKCYNCIPIKYHHVLFKTVLSLDGMFTVDLLPICAGTRKTILLPRSYFNVRA